MRTHTSCPDACCRGLGSTSGQSRHHEHPSCSEACCRAVAYLGSTSGQYGHRELPSRSDSSEASHALRRRTFPQLLLVTARRLRALIKRHWLPGPEGGRGPLSGTRGRGPLSGTRGRGPLDVTAAAVGSGQRSGPLALALLLHVQQAPGVQHTASAFLDRFISACNTAGRCRCGWH